MPNLTGKTTTIDKIAENTAPTENGVVLYGTNTTFNSSKVKLSAIFGKTVFSGLKTTAKNIIDAINELKFGVDGLSADTGWINVIGTSIAGPDIVAPSLNTPLRYRKKNGVVYINGCFGVTNKVASKNTLLFTLPEDCRPANLLYAVNTATGSVVSRYNVTASGGVNLAWVRNLTDGAEITGAITWAGIDISFPV